MDIYDADSQSWSTATLSVGRVGLVGAFISGKILFAGGQTSSFSCSRVVDIFELITGRIFSVPKALSVARSNLQAVSV